MSDEPDFADTLEGEIILDMIANGQTLRAASAAVGVPYSTIFFRIGRHPKFKERMEDARSAGYEVLAEQCLEIADDGRNDLVETEDRFGNPKIKLDKDHIQRSKLRVETRLKLLAKWHPKKYGEKLEIEQKTATVAIPVSDDPIAAQRAYEQLMKGG